LGQNDLEVIIMGKRTPVNIEVRPRHRDEPPERLIKRFMKKVKNARILEQVLEKKRYEKPSVKRRKEKIKRKRVLEKLNKERQQREEQKQK
jgi:ribosomal protein S21